MGWPPHMGWGEKINPQREREVLDTYIKFVLQEKKYYINDSNLLNRLKEILEWDYHSSLLDDYLPSKKVSLPF